MYELMHSFTSCDDDRCVQVVYLRRWPLLRDCIFYAFSVILLVFTIKDEAVYWSVGFFTLY